MGVRLLTGTYDGTQHGATVMVDSTNNIAFGPVFDSYTDAEEFIASLPHDPRSFSTWTLHRFFQRWQADNEAAESEKAFAEELA